MTLLRVLTTVGGAIVGKIGGAVMSGISGTFSRGEATLVATDSEGPADAEGSAVCGEELTGAGALAA